MISTSGLPNINFPDIDRISRRKLLAFIQENNVALTQVYRDYVL